MQRVMQLVLLGLVLAWSTQAQAVLEVTVTEGVSGAIPVAVAPFAWEGEGGPDAAVGSILAANLTRSGLFDVERSNLPPCRRGRRIFSLVLGPRRAWNIWSSGRSVATRTT